MPAYYRASFKSFLNTKDSEIIAQLTTAYAKDGYVSQYTSATTAWTLTLPALRQEFNKLLSIAPQGSMWQLLLEYPLYRLRRRIDAVVISPLAVIVIELKTAANTFDAADKRQVVEYAQDLRDFHAGSRELHLSPVLWAIESVATATVNVPAVRVAGVGELSLVGKEGMADALLGLAGTRGFDTEEQSDARGQQWNRSSYDPVPSVIDAAIALFAGHGVREIAIAGAKNLSEAADTVLSIIANSRKQSEHAVVFLIGAPGAGKTLAGLNIVHTAIDRALMKKGDVVYLSGNTPLVVVLREALAQDKYRRDRATGTSSTIRDARAFTRTTIQHINDFLQEYVRGTEDPPAGHVIVFDEAQRAWDAKQGKEKFGRDASEPRLVLNTMARHLDWSVTVCLVGTGQEINDGEEGLAGWAEAIDCMITAGGSRWKVYGSATVFGETRTAQTLGKMRSELTVCRDEALRLDIPMRSFRSPKFGEWIEALLRSELDKAKLISQQQDYPLQLTRSLSSAKTWLERATRGERRMGLLASSGARRLRADGLGEVLNATDGSSIAHWYLNPPGDIRSSYALEVPANEYTSQGLELDYACLCWGGDLVRRNSSWSARRLSGNRWNNVADPKGALYVLNSYRVLLSRAREGLVIWVPQGVENDHTRQPEELDQVAQALLDAGFQMLDAGPIEDTTSVMKSR